VAVFTAEEAVGGREWQRRLGGGGGGGRGAMVHVRARRGATITDSPPPLGEGLGFAAARREDDRFVVGKLRFGAPSLLWGKRRLKNRQIILLSCNNYRSPCATLKNYRFTFTGKQKDFFSIQTPE